MMFLEPKFCTVHCLGLCVSLCFAGFSRFKAFSGLVEYPSKVALIDVGKPVSNATVKTIIDNVECAV